MFFMVVYGGLWWFMVVYGCLWLFMVVYGGLWLFVVVYDGLNGSVRDSLGEGGGMMVNFGFAGMA
ncbi:MAG TPA: hypothetical protein PKB07_23205 [Flavilitoribacter sp.]|nr:hypothetical protein [Flavilitoribacter sp.]